MEKAELIKIVEEKWDKISNIKNDIRKLVTEYATNNCKFKNGDILKSDTFSYEKDIVLKYIGESDYIYELDLIYVNCEVITSNTDKVKIGTIYSIPEKYLKLNNNG